MTPTKDDVLPGLGSKKNAPRVAAQIDWSQLVLDDRNGFVLSRIDGRTTLGEICLLAPFPEAETVAILRQLHQRGVIEIPGVAKALIPPPPSPPSTPPAAPPESPRPIESAPPIAPPVAAKPVVVASPPPPTPAPKTYRFPDRAPPVARSITPPPWTLIEPSQILPEPEPYRFPTAQTELPEKPAHLDAGDSLEAAFAFDFPSVSVAAPMLPPLTAPQATPAPVPVRDVDEVDLPPDVRMRVDEMLAMLGQVDAAQLLGVAPGTDKKEIRRIYFRLSKEFHPDRYFQRQLGPYKRHLQQVFNGITEAFRQLTGYKG